ncbi:MAG: MGH1-like glycoside hydrolase domain-containing protein, partial [Anaerolineae bacterium]
VPGRGELLRLLFTENDTNHERLFNTSNPTPYVKDAFHEVVVNGREDRVNPEQEGTKVAAHCRAMVPPGESFVVQTRFTWTDVEDPFGSFAFAQDKPFATTQNRPFDSAQDSPSDSSKESSFDEVFERRIAEADEFYAALRNPGMDGEERRVQRQAFAGLMWTKQFYHYSVQLWLDGDPAQPEPPPERKDGRNSDWKQHLYNLDVHAVPDTWEFPWYAAWDTAFHTLPIAMIDPEWARRQLILLLREWYMHPNGQIPAYEWNFSDVNPPVHAWAAWHVYRIVEEVTGEADTAFLERIFQKLLLNFTWWVNQKDRDGNNVFQGGFLGLDNIGVFDRSGPLPLGGYIEQADGTAWMAMYCLNMLTISLELARTRPAYEDVATKFFEHFVYIAHALTHLGTEEDRSLWSEDEGFFFDMLHLPDGSYVPLKVYSLVGLIPLFAAETLDADLVTKLPHFWARMQWFIKYRPHLVRSLASLTEPGEGECRLLALVDRDKLQRIMQRMLDPEAFLSDYGLRSLSRYHREHPYTFEADGQIHTVRYEPGVSRSTLFGGNSNWRGPIWFPVNYLMIESLRKYHEYYGDSFKVELPTGSGNYLTLDEVATELGRRLTCIFLPDGEGRRPVFGDGDLFRENPDWRDYILFHEYFHGDTGAGLGASHQTGWTALVANLIQQCFGAHPCE